MRSPRRIRCFLRAESAPVRLNAMNDWLTRHFEIVRRSSPHFRAHVLAEEYARQLWRLGAVRTLASDTVDSPYHVALGLGKHDLSSFTKRAALVTDTLVLSRELRDARLESNATLSPVEVDGSGPAARSVYAFTDDSLGWWLAEAKPLISSGAVWYLPQYLTVPGCHSFGVRLNGDASSFDEIGFEYEAVPTLDFLVRDGRAVEASGVNPMKSRIVRPVIQLEIPVIEGTTLGDFSKITMDEFASYASFRDFLRGKMLDLDSSLNAVDSEVELAKVGLEISDQVRDIDSRLRQVRRKRAVQASGAVIGTLGATLVAVYGPALQAVVTSIGAGAGAWAFLNALVENSTRPLRDEKWYYVWALAKKAGNIR